jgi:hypothetical protein
MEWREVMTMTLKHKQKLTTTLTPEQVSKIREISRFTRIAQSELFREAVEDLIRKYEGLVSDDFKDKVETYLDSRKALMERLAR